MIRKSTEKFKGVAKLALKEYNGSDDVYYFKIPSQSVAQSTKMISNVNKSSSDDIAQMRAAGAVFEGFVPDTSRGTTISFVDFIENVVPDIDQESFADILKLAGLSRSELALRDDVIIEE